MKLISRTPKSSFYTNTVITVAKRSPAMASSSTPRIEALSRPEPLKEVLAQDKVEDCLPCRITGRKKLGFVWHSTFVDHHLGAAAFMGLGVYSYFSGHSQLRAQQAKILQSKSLFGLKSRQAGITGIALTLAGMGFWRLVN
jgi:hypothetical protein